jgi:hypothetical protein
MAVMLPDIAYLKSILEYRDGSLYHKQNRGKARAGEIAGSLSKHYWVLRIDGKNYYAHRIVFLMNHGWCPEVIDHINGDKLDNRIENLRPASASQNTWNSPARKNNSHGAKNLTFDKRSNFWYVKFWVNGRRKNFGCFKDKSLAIEFAELARDMLYGQFARHA